MYRFVKVLSGLHVNGASKLLVSQMSQCRPADILAINLQDLGGQHGTNVSCWPKISSEGQGIIQDGREVIPEHYPVVPAKLADVADVGGTASHDGLRDFSPCHIDLVAGARPN